jgi:hypothetical protein
MPQIDYDGRFYVKAVSAANDSRAAIGFPVKASRVSTAMRFADKMIPRLLPGWSSGTVRLSTNGRVLHTWVLRMNRGEQSTDAGGEAMKRKRVWRYYCSYCKKSGCSKHHLERHEERCTMNPNRACGVCRLLDVEQGPLAPLLESLPNPAEYQEFDEFGCVEFRLGFRDAVRTGVAKVREATNNCPACLMAAIRQRGIPMTELPDFDWEKEIEAARHVSNEREMAECHHG